MEPLVLVAQRTLDAVDGDDAIWLRHSLVVPAYIAVGSAIVLTTRALSLTSPLRKLRVRISEAEDQEEQCVERDALTGTPGIARFKLHVLNSGGFTIFSFRFARLLSALGLLLLSIATFLHDQKDRVSVDNPRIAHTHRLRIDLALCLTYVYASSLAIISVTASPKHSAPAIRHLNLLLLATFCVYAYRDLWPLATFTLSPADQLEDALLWVKISLLTFASIFIPLTIPRQYMPYNPMELAAEPNPEQTASILSLAVYSFVTPIISLANRIPHLPIDQLPPLPDYDHVKNLVAQSFKHLDTFSGAPKQHIFWGLITVFSREYLVLAVLLLLRVIATFLGPIGINGILKYMETLGEGSVVRPWVWALALFISPLIESIAMQHYLFIATILLNRANGFLTQLVFEHSLRIRMTAETNEETTQGDASEATVTPDNASVAESGSESFAAGDADRSPSDHGVDGKGKQKANSEDAERSGPSQAAAGSKASNLVGKINNLITSDLSNLLDGRDFLFIRTSILNTVNAFEIVLPVVQMPFEIGLCVYFLYTYLGWSAFVGMASMVMLFPVPGKLAQLLQNVQKEAAKATDARVQTVTETMSVLRMVKLFGWESKIDQRVAEKREFELKNIRTKNILKFYTSLINYIVPVITMIVTFGTYTAIMKKELKPSIIFPSMTVFNMLSGQVHMVFFRVPQMIQAKVSMDRITDFLQNTELLDEYAAPADQLVNEAHKDDIGFGNASFTWSNNDAADGAVTPSRRRFVLRIEDDLLFKKGCINLIIGPTGSGKTSLLMALLGEMHFIPTNLESWYHLPRAGGVAYAAQESWVQNETIRDNILFGTPYDETRYNKVIYQCGLKRDLSLFDAGDKTEVGEKGLTLSGGQKARVTLARAIYSSADILLLDDILAALDVHTARWIVNKCFRGDLIRGRTILLVTHNVALASPIAEYVVSLGLNGTIATRGSVSEAIAVDETLKAELAEEVEAIAEDDEEIDAKEPDDSSKPADGKLVVAEEIAIGHITWGSVKLFLVNISGHYGVLFWTIFLGSSVLFQIGMAGQTWWMGHWAEQYDIINDPSKISVPFYLGVYIIILLVSLLVNAIGLTAYIFGTLRASRLIHRMLIRSILGTTLRWLDTTPVSRVITRCTQDTRVRDGPIADMFSLLVEIVVDLFIHLAGVVIFTPVFLFPGIVLAILGIWIGRIFMRAQISIQREGSNAKAPVLGHFGAAIAGLTSIRAYGAQIAFRQESYKRIDRNIRVSRTLYNINRWVTIRIDALGAFFSAGLAMYLVYGPNHQNAIPSNTGFSLNMAFMLTSTLLWLVRIYSAFEGHANSLERIRAYIDIEQEPKATNSGVPPAYWPASGDLRVENLSARYSKDGPEVLHNLSFHIKSGERVGVVGRTGSGKSSLTLSLLRCIPTEGNVYYDGLPMSSVNLDNLRSSITIIPQMPELLSGTLRENLDPFGQFDDAALNSALRAAGLFALQVDSDDNRVTLDSAVSSGGGNLSVGQRQILALARAIVRGSKLLILDEATSAIDYETDTIIQSSLRHELKGDVTLLTIAHRLQTIMDADKIMVLDAGRIVEFDKPSELLNKEGGWFHSLVYESGDRDALLAMVSSSSD
ncbi:P-loop containing nucleoside triphosphate hydrolase protein [Artomyces pyxidatus]|uniref:P-loop containing nucleoside triphosphate hydrolase protein n=1 Tax=Artomyces pyxidatus TaxID=48021 RepID=A0ACB8TDR3_9AGAM|nr:P-loop containing nucleoside triphosphate hydrolase protein [Artomyces pyxidatus]